jgi:hypothetical protein
MVGPEGRCMVRFSFAIAGGFSIPQRGYIYKLGVTPRASGNDAFCTQGVTLSWLYIAPLGHGEFFRLYFKLIIEAIEPMKPTAAAIHVHQLRYQGFLAGSAGAVGDIGNGLF